MPFDEKPSTGQQPHAEGDVDEFSRLFGALEQASSSAEAQPFAPQPTAATPLGTRSAEDPAPGEFTQIFRQIAKPTSRPPDLDEAPSLPADADSGEFTQFFQAPKVAASASIAPVVAQPPPISVPPESASVAAAPGSFTQLFGQPLGGAGTAASTSALGNSPEQRGRAPAPLPFADATAAQSARREVFAAVDGQRGASPAFLAPAGGDPATEAQTQIFQMEEPKPVRPQAVPDRAPAPVRSSPPAAAAGSGPGEFTRLMKELNANPAPNAPSSFQPPPPQRSQGSQGPQAGPGEFTRLMQGLEAASPGMTPLAPMPPAQPIGHAAQLAGSIAGPGEFTRLMQNLASSSAAPASNLGAPVAPLDSVNVAAGESEYTRVMRGSSLREASSSLAASPVVATPTAPAAETPKDKGKAEGGTKSKKLLVILLVANLLLLLVLIALAFLFLRHRH